jgi:adenine-specific DNA-methyltransferase
VTTAGPVTTDLQLANLSSNELEQVYASNSDLAHRKKLGQFFTPFSVARFMSQWITQVSADNPYVLDPCAGLGVFERAICEFSPVFANKAQFTLWEIDERLAGDLSGICERLAIENSIVSKDFIDEHAWSAAYDAIIANPPYYKHHFVENKEDIRKVISANAGAPFSVQTNIYCWFLIKALTLLRPAGRLAFIIPTEFLNANYGRDVKNYLLETGFLRHIISICYKSRTFDDAITTACVLLAEKGEESTNNVRFYRADSSDELIDLADFLSDGKFVEYKSADLDPESKWRSYFPGGHKEQHRKSALVPFSTYGRFSRGIATGANEFFAIRPSRAAELGLPSKCLIPCLSKARQAPGKVFASRDFEALKQADQPVFLFDGQAASRVAVDRYIRFGEESGFNDRYLTRVRKPWFALEKRTPGKIWVGVFSRGGVRFIWNDSDCISLTCFHVFQPSDVGQKYLPFIFLYLNSAAGRHFLEFEKREYGDGLAKFEPNDINKAQAPDFSRLDQGRIDRLITLQKSFKGCEKDSREEVAILDEADSIFQFLLN